MRVLVAPDCFSGTLTAPHAAAAMARGWLRSAPGDLVEECPLADGGPGFVAVLHHALGGELGSVTVSGPLGVRVPATVLLVETEAGVTAYVESAEAAGLALVPLAERDPTRATSRGVGELVRAALDAGARRIVVGVGGTATNDAGAGLLAGLAGGEHENLERGGGALDAVTPRDLAVLGALANELADVDLVAAVDVDVPLLGMHGASAGFAEQ
ncbi:MAG: glycerate kinase, partial [Actinomycetota bacterium]|nr:glycerate kinase [Actinomycetota bacterium]